LNRLFNSNFYKTFTDDNYLFKVELYNQSRLCSPARRDKATGFEEYRKYLNEKHKISGEDYFDVNYRRPMELIVQDPSYTASADVDFQSLYDLYINYEKIRE
jgi:hypothetical protein